MRNSHYFPEQMGTSLLSIFPQYMSELKFNFLSGALLINVLIDSALTVMFIKHASWRLWSLPFWNRKGLQWDLKDLLWCQQSLLLCIGISHAEDSPLWNKSHVRFTQAYTVSRRAERAESWVYQQHLKTKTSEVCSWQSNKDGLLRVLLAAS